MISEKVSVTYCPSREPRLLSRQEMTDTFVINSEIVQNFLDFSEKFMFHCFGQWAAFFCLNISSKIAGLSGRAV
jgi:hypothetical protein